MVVGLSRRLAVLGSGGRLNSQSGGMVPGCVKKSKRRCKSAPLAARRSSYCVVGDVVAGCAVVAVGDGGTGFTG